MVNVAIIGATGYTAEEAIKILLRHPQVKITCLTAREDKCGPVEVIFPALKDRLDLSLELADVAAIAQKADVALCCLPHKVSMEFVAQLIKADVKVVDFSADYRLHDVSLYEKTYQVEHCDKKNLAQAAFGLPELFRESIRGAKLVANPGCYPTAASLAIAPLLKENLIALDDIIINAVSGVSGAGRNPSQEFHYPQMNENLFAYGVGSHRHQPEIEQILTDYSDQKVKVLFQPHVGSFDRGISESIYCRPLKQVEPKQMLDLYQSFYKDEPFVRILDKPPAIKQVAHTNFCDIFPTMAQNRIVVFSAIDNLIKGAAGQAVQNMNIICDMDETTGLL
jgi:N-acetyl-gamma-glutamyl-phosphate reductase